MKFCCDKNIKIYRSNNFWRRTKILLSQNNRWHRHTPATWFEMDSVLFWKHWTIRLTKEIMSLLLLKFSRGLLVPAGKNFVKVQWIFLRYLQNKIKKLYFFINSYIYIYIFSHIYIYIYIYVLGEIVRKKMKFFFHHLNVFLGIPWVPLNFFRFFGVPQKKLWRHKYGQNKHF